MPITDRDLNLLSYLDGMRVITNPMLTVAGDPVTETVRRTWTERLLTRPWRPWQATKTRTWTPQIPDPTVYRLANSWLMHPATFAALKADLERQGAKTWRGVYGVNG